MPDAGIAISIAFACYVSLFVIMNIPIANKNAKQKIVLFFRFAFLQIIIVFEVFIPISDICRSCLHYFFASSFFLSPFSFTLSDSMLSNQSLSNMSL